LLFFHDLRQNLVQEVAIRGHHGATGCEQLRWCTQCS